MTPTELLLDRASCKSYTSEPLLPDEARLIVQAGQAAPSGMNRQPTAFLAVLDPAIRDRLSRLNAAVLQTKTDPFYGAPAVFAILADPSASTYLYDGSLAAGQMLLQANALEFRRVLFRSIHRAKEMFETEEGKSILKQAGLPEDYEGIGFVIAGHPATKPAVKKKTSLTGWLV